MDVFAAYRQAELPTPKVQRLWPLYGAGFENLGRDGETIEVPTLVPGTDELLVRHDAVGLCFSDIKVIKAGETHPRLAGRDMANEPVVLGHEVALTVMAVGDNLEGTYSPGDRFIVQADIYYKGIGLAYGYALQGGLSQFNVIGKEILDGDEGVYLIPVQSDTGYAQAALTEPWACIVASYDVPYRVGWKPGGRVLIVAGAAAGSDYVLGTPFAGGQPPATIEMYDVVGTLRHDLVERAAAAGIDLVTLDAPPWRETPTVEYDDIVFLGADADLFEAAAMLAANGCLLNVVGGQGLDRPVQVDVGRLHYDNIALVGTEANDISLAYVPIRTELYGGGAAAFLGAAGPMGQMHVQRALQQQDGPRLIVATDLVAERLGVIEVKYAELIHARQGTTQVVLETPDGRSGAEFNAALMDLTSDAGFDDIVVLAPSAGLVASAVGMLAEGGVMNIFAGLPRGTMAPIDLSQVSAKGIRFTGSSGSAIRDLRNMLAQAESGELDPNLSVAAISGLADARAGLEGVAHQGFPGKVVVYPQIVDFPLTALSDLKNVAPSVYAKLGPNESWTVEAETEFLTRWLPGGVE